MALLPSVHPALSGAHLRLSVFCSQEFAPRPLPGTRILAAVLWTMRLFAASMDVGRTRQKKRQKKRHTPISSSIITHELHEQDMMTYTSALYTRLNVAAERTAAESVWVALRYVTMV